MELGAHIRAGGAEDDAPQPSHHCACILACCKPGARDQSGLAGNGNSAFGLRVDEGEVPPKDFGLANRGSADTDSLTFHEKLGVESVMRAVLK